MGFTPGPPIGTTGSPEGSGFFSSSSRPLPVEGRPGGRKVGVV